MNIQPILQNNHLILIPLEEADFKAMYKTASDPKIWEQHPNKDRWQREVFQFFFEGAIISKGAFKILVKETSEIIGSTRFYDYDEENKSIFIGYTFYAVSSWGKGFNPAVKAMMLEYIFPFVEKVYFHIGAHNVRSQIAIGRLGAKKVDEQEVAYFGEQSQLNFTYEISKEQWDNLRT